MFVQHGEIILQQIDNVEIKQNTNQLKELYRRFSNLNSQWRDKIKINNLDKFGNFQSTIVLTNQRILIFAPQSQKIMQFLNNIKPIAVKIFYEIYLSLITQIINVQNIQQGQQVPDAQQSQEQKAVIKLTLYDNNVFQISFPQPDNQFIDFIRKSTDGRVHFIKHFIQTHIYQQKLLQTNQPEPLFGFQVLQRKINLQIFPQPIQLSSFYNIEILQNLHRFSISKNQTTDNECNKQLEPFIKMLQRDLQSQDIPFKTDSFILGPQENNSKSNYILSLQNVNFNTCITYPPYYITVKELENHVKGFAQNRFPVMVAKNIYRCGRLIGNQKVIEDLLTQYYYVDDESNDSSLQKLRMAQQTGVIDTQSNDYKQALSQDPKVYVISVGECGFLRSNKSIVLQLQLSYKEIYDVLKQKINIQNEQKNDSVINSMKSKTKLDQVINKYLTACKLIIQLRKQGVILICGTEERLIGSILLFLVDLLDGQITSHERFISYFDWHFAAFGYPIFSLYHSALLSRIKKAFEPQTLPDDLHCDFAIQFMMLVTEEWIMQQSHNIDISITFGQKLLHEIYSFKLGRYLFDTEAERFVSGMIGLVNNKINLQEAIGLHPSFYPVITKHTE